MIRFRFFFSDSSWLEWNPKKHTMYRSILVPLIRIHFHQIFEGRQLLSHDKEG